MKMNEVMWMFDGLIVVVLVVVALRFWRKKCIAADWRYMCMYSNQKAYQQDYDRCGARWSGKNPVRCEYTWFKTQDERKNFRTETILKRLAEFGVDGLDTSLENAMKFSWIEQGINDLLIVRRDEKADLNILRLHCRRIENLWGFWSEEIEEVSTVTRTEVCAHCKNLGIRNGALWCETQAWWVKANSLSCKKFDYDYESKNKTPAVAGKNKE
jgi:hypothetical protein